MTDDDDAEMNRLCALHDKWGAHVDVMIAEGQDPREVSETMLTVAIASALKVVGVRRTAHALLSAYGPLRAVAMQDAEQPMRPN